MATKDQRPIIIVKKVKKGHAAHHGGSWKVAYADFVTAMMAFFLVMWILGMEEEVRASIEAYFSNPVGIEEGYAAGPGLLSGQTPSGRAPAAAVTLVTRQFERQRYQQLAERLQERLAAQDGLGGLAAQVEIVLSEEGLRIELVEGGDGEMFFGFGSAALKPAAARALAVIGDELEGSGSRIVVEGHTDAARYGSRDYTNWELSADRANAARRALEGSALGPGRITEVRGHADRQLRVPDGPFDPSNRRITILLPYATAPAAAAGEASPSGAGGPAPEETPDAGR